MRGSDDHHRLRPHLRPGASTQTDRPKVEAVDTSSVKAGPGVAGGDKRQLRGLPTVAPGVAGVAPGTDPLRALLAKQPRDS